MNNNENSLFYHTLTIIDKIDSLAELNENMDKDMFDKTTSFEEQMIAENPMLHLAQAMMLDNPILAQELADYIDAISLHTHFCCEHCDMPDDDIEDYD